MRAGIVVTGTEVLTGRVQDRNGPWLAERLLELGLDVAPLVVVGDRPEEMRAALAFLAGQPDVALIVTSGGLGPTDDDLTTAVVAAFQGREMILDAALEQRITAIVEPLLARWPNVDPDATRRATRKQARVPDGAAVLEPVGTAPGVIVAPSSGSGPTVVVLPGPPGELQAMWRAAVDEPAFAAAIAGAGTLRQETLRLFGVPESEIVATLDVARAEGVALDDLEVTTCLRGGELEIVSRFDPSASGAYDGLVEVVRARHADTLFSEDGLTVDQQVAGLLRESGRTIAVCESCTGGLLAGRLTRLAGSSAYVLGGVTVYSNALKEELAGVPHELIVAHGAVSLEVAEALAWGATALGASVGVGVTGIAGPGGGTEDKPVGTVCFAVVCDGRTTSRRIQLPGSRDDVRDRSTTVALHMVRRALLAA